MKVLTNLKPEDVRLPPMRNGCRPIAWPLVDPWLRLCDGRGDVSRLARLLAIAPSTLLHRRHIIGLNSLPVGRPLTEKLTGVQQDISERLEAGETVTNIAKERGVTTQCISGMKKRIEKKKAIWERLCKACDGRGVRPCGSDGEPICYGGAENPKHNHICQHCGGKGTND